MSDVPKQAVILAGGEGTRLRPITYEISKQLIPVQGKPIMTWLVRWLHRAGVERVLVTVRPQWEEAYEKWKNDVVDSVDSAEIELWVEPEPMGTLGGIVHHLQERLGDEPVIITNGDELKGLSLERLAEAHHAFVAEQPTHGATIALVEVPNPREYGVAEMEGSRITRFHEKPETPPSNLVSSGLYMIEPTAFLDVTRERPHLMFENDLWPMLASQGRLGGCRLEGAWFDCGNLERWERAIREWREEGKSL